MATNIYVSNKARIKSNESILITGSARSGTTIIGKLVNSFSNVEYLFEPPIIISLLTLINEIPENNWRLLFETYLYEEFLLNSISGRSINCNKQDDSSIYNVKSERDIDDRLNSTLRKIDSEVIASTRKVVYKIPDISFFVEKLLDYYPDLKVITMRRGVIGTINSLLQKGWFSSKDLCPSLIWPFFIHEGEKLPYWVNRKDSDYWLSLNELDRCAYYYIRVNDSLNRIENRIDIRYEDLLNNPEEVAKNLKIKLNLKYGEKTENIVSSIKPTNKDRDYDLLNKINPKLTELIENIPGYSNN